MTLKPMPSYILKPPTRSSSGPVDTCAWMCHMPLKLNVSSPLTFKTYQIQPHNLSLQTDLTSLQPRSNL